MQPIGETSLLRTLTAPSSLGRLDSRPRRKELELLRPTDAFIKPVRQNFVRNPRLMPMTRCMVLMLLGWAGKEQPIETTVSIIAKKLGRSVRQVHRYLRDAIEEGYLYYSRTKNRWGYYTGIKIHLNFEAIKPRPLKKRRSTVMTHTADTNNNSIFIRENTPEEQKYLDKIDAILLRNGLPSLPE